MYLEICEWVYACVSVYPRTDIGNFLCVCVSVVGYSIIIIAVAFLVTLYNCRFSRTKKNIAIEPSRAVSSFVACCGCADTSAQKTHPRLCIRFVGLFLAVVVCLFVFANVIFWSKCLGFCAKCGISNFYPSKLNNNNDERKKRLIFQLKNCVYNVQCICIGQNEIDFISFQIEIIFEISTPHIN